MTTKKTQEYVHKDSTGSGLGFWSSPNFDGFMLVAIDDSGYISVELDKSEWEQLKYKVDTLIAEQEGK